MMPREPVVPEQAPGNDAPADDLRDGHSAPEAAVDAAIQAAMREGYSATREDREALNRDWGAIDTEGWPD